MEEIDKTKVSIGLPILNGGEFIVKRLENILTQTFSEFELIISNNASTDSTLKICKEFAEKDSRIKIYNQNKTINAEKNFAFVLDQAKYKYFVWASIDDLWHKTFLEKNVEFLEKNPKYINCSGKVERFGDKEINLKIKASDLFLIKIYKKCRSQFRPFHNLSFTGKYEKKASKCFKHNNMLFLFGLFKTEIIKKCVIDYQIHSSDLIMCLRTLEYGDVNIIDDVTWYFYVKGLSSQGIRKQFKTKEISLFEIFFPFVPLTIWCRNHFGIKFILKNIKHVIWLNLIFGIIPLLLEFLKFKDKS